MKYCLTLETLGFVQNRVSYISASNIPKPRARGPRPGGVGDPGGFVSAVGMDWQCRPSQPAPLLNMLNTIMTLFSCMVLHFV